MGKPPQQLPGEPTVQPRDSDESAKRSELLAIWLDAHGDALYRFAMQKLHDEHVAADVLQETFLAAFQGATNFRGDSQVRTWLISILRLKIIDWQRRTHRQSRTLEQMSERATAPAFRQKRLEAWPNVADEFGEQEFWSVVRQCVEKLPASLAKAFLLREMDGHSASDVCSILGISAKNLAVRLYRARAGLRNCLDDNWFAEK